MTCDACQDTHRMQIGDREVMCTRCPTPCHDCGGGPYCRNTPCACSCHREAPASVSRFTTLQLRTLPGRYIVSVEAKAAKSWQRRVAGCLQDVTMSKVQAEQLAAALNEIEVG